jgi:hypothetical protein
MPYRVPNAVAVWSRCGLGIVALRGDTGSSARRPVASGVLVCDEWRKVSDERARHWRALLGTEDDDTDTVLVLCPGCASAGDADAAD